MNERPILDAFADVQQPRHHPSDVRFYLARGIFVAVGVFIIVELAYAWTHRCASLQATLDAFGLFDAAIFALLGTVLGFYFASKANE